MLEYLHNASLMIVLRAIITANTRSPSFVIALVTYRALNRVLCDEYVHVCTHIILLYGGSAHHKMDMYQFHGCLWL